MSPRDLDPLVRAALPSDAEALGRLGAQLVRVHHELDAARFLPPTAGTERGYAAFLASQVGRSDAVVLVVERQGALIGYAYAAIEGTDYMSLRGPAGVLHDLLVDSAHRGAGVGRLLLAVVLQTLKERGVPQVVLVAAVANEPARRLFASAGFRATMLEMTIETSGAE